MACLSLDPVSAGEQTWGHLFLAEVRPYSGQAYSGHPGGEESQEDGRGGPLRYVQVQVTPPGLNEKYSFQ